MPLFRDSEESAACARSVRRTVSQGNGHRLCVLFRMADEPPSSRFGPDDQVTLLADVRAARERLAELIRRIRETRSLDTAQTLRQRFDDWSSQHRVQRFGKPEK